MSRKARGVSLIVVYQRDLIPPDTVFLYNLLVRAPPQDLASQDRTLSADSSPIIPRGNGFSDRSPQPPAEGRIVQVKGEHIHILVELPVSTTASSRREQELLDQVASLQALLNKSVHETPLKAFSDWTFPKVCQLYGLGESDDPTMEVFPVFSCVIFGLNGHGPLDFTIDLRQTAKTVGVTEVKKDDFVKGVTQCVVQLESSLSNRKRKINEMEEDQPTFRRVFGIVTDAEKFYFMECTMDDQDRPNFKLSELMVVVYKDENLETKVEKVLGHIVWRRRSPTQLG
ncbi:uncharacterized protein OCT59_014452 [Rhizophagus irregularis]|uniref:uncharacterized protein n=1 Tax=Rhizophagus irregularis TaxID=588596 RepID=UPI00331F50D6|nr:hypothetical protein OCT59_014452 [Rhizophagus irregularis]